MITDILFGQHRQTLSGLSFAILNVILITVSQTHNKISVDFLALNASVLCSRSYAPHTHVQQQCVCVFSKNIHAAARIYMCTHCQRDKNGLTV